jgi:Leucine-rich repeat (LRR) protein
MDEVSLIIRRARRSNSKVIDLSSRNLTSIPSDLIGVKTLETINLSHNLIVSIPDNISELENLIKLDLSYNNISTLPQSIALLSNLQQLNLDSNPIGFGNLFSAALKSKLSLDFSASKPENFSSTFSEKAREFL